MIKLNKGWQRWLNSRLWILLAAAALLGLAMSLEAVNWRFELMVHFRVQAFAGVSALLLLALLLRAWMPGAGLAVLAVVLGLPITPLWLDHSRHAEKADFSVGSVNVLTSNSDADSLLAEVRRHRPDLLLLMEVDREWLRDLEPLQELYPHAIAAPRSDNFGIALFSKVPFESADIVEWGQAWESEQVPSVVARVVIKRRSVCLVGTHPVPPSTRRATESRNQQLSEAAEFVRRLPADVKVVMAGDFNTTRFSSSFHRLLETSGLHDTANGFGFAPTWPAGKPWFYIAIDHLLVSDNLRVASREVGQSIGSDHYPLWVGLTFQPERPE